MIIGTSSEIILDNFKVMLNENNNFLFSYCNEIISTFDIEPRRIFNIVLGFSPLKEITEYEYYAICWGFANISDKYKHFFKQVPQINNMKINLKDKTVTHLQENRFQNVLEIVPGERWIARITIDELNSMVSAKTIRQDNFIEQTLIESENKESSYTTHINRTSVRRIAELIQQNKYFSVPITVGTLQDCLQFENGELTIQNGDFYILDGLHTLLACQELFEENLGFPVIIHFCKFKDVKEMKEVVVQMDNKNRLRKKRGGSGVTGNSIALLINDSLYGDADSPLYGSPDVVNKEVFSKILVGTLKTKKEAKGLAEIFKKVLSGIDKNWLEKSRTGKYSFKQLYIIVRACTLYRNETPQTICKAVQYAFENIQELNKPKFAAREPKQVCTRDVDKLVKGGIDNATRKRIY